MKNKNIVIKYLILVNLLIVFLVISSVSFILATAGSIEDCASRSVTNCGSPALCIACNGKCVPTGVFNCYSCGNTCASNEGCYNAVDYCTPCTSGLASCGLIGSRWNAPVGSTPGYTDNMDINCGINLNNDAFNCGSCGNKCNTGEYCSNGICNYCGDGFTNSGHTSGINIPLEPNTGTYDSYSGSAYQDSLVTEVCDTGASSANKIISCSYTSSATNVIYAGNKLCKSDCTGYDECVPYESCGDNTCQRSGGENESNCFKDCNKAIDGWTASDASWTVDSNNILTSSGGYTSISSDPFDLKTEAYYNLSLDISLPVGCQLNVGLNQGVCNSFSTNSRTNCFTYSDNSITSTNPDFISSSFLINAPSTSHATNSIYFKDVQLKISIGDHCSGVLLANISLKEIIPDSISYDNTQLPDYGALSGCCPSDFCWNGEYCANSSLWMDNATYPAVWNNLFDTDWNYNHINTSSQLLAKGYRCVIVNTTTNEAQWISSEIKYDWNYLHSGYCAHVSDCFVSESYNPNNTTYSDGCIHDGDTISEVESPVRGEGNHYCYNGSWTTKSYIVATLLQNISQNHPYILQCYDNSSIAYNVPLLPFDGKILSACVIIQQTSSDTEQVITGVVLNNDTDAGKFIDALKTEYRKIYSIEEGIDEGIDVNCGTPIENSNFKQCADVSNLKVYYEPNYKYFIISDKNVDGLYQPTIWDNISKFFKELFSQNNDIVTTAYSALDYTTSYDRIYVMQNGTLNVTGIEESKYDETEQRIVNVLYVNYVGSNQTNNPFNREAIFKTLNTSTPKREVLQLTCVGCTDTIRVQTKGLSNGIIFNITATDIFLKNITLYVYNTFDVLVREISTTNLSLSYTLYGGLSVVKYKVLLYDATGKNATIDLRTIPIVNGEELSYSYDYKSNYNSQSIIIKTENRTGLWPYFTSILRNRPAGYQ